jgi:hypothetical protein
VSTVRLPTFSALERAAACPGSVVIPATGDVSTYAEDGNAKHDYLEAVQRDGLATALAAAKGELRQWAEALAYDELPLEVGAYAAEVAFSFDTFAGTARELGRGIGRAYPELGPSEVAGTVDLVGLADDGETVIVIDWKTGSQPVTAAHRNWQMRAGAVAAARAYDRSRAVVQVAYLAHGYTDSATFDSWELESAAQELATLVALWHSQAQRERPALTRGPHCRYCPGFDSCPAQHELLQIAVRRPDDLAQETEVALTNGGRARAYEIRQQLALLVKRLGERVDAHAAVRPIDLGNGRFYGFAPGKRAVQDATRARDVLLEAGVPAEAVAAAVTETTELHTTVGGIDKALKKLPKEQREAVVQRLSVTGAVAQAVTMREFELEEVKP